MDFETPIRSSLETAQLGCKTTGSLEAAFVTGTNWETCAIKKEIKKLEMENSNYELQRIIRSICVIFPFLKQVPKLSPITSTVSNGPLFCVKLGFFTLFFHVEGSIRQKDIFCISSL